MWYVYLIVLVIGIVIGVFICGLFIPNLGTLQIDMHSNEDRDIARFEFDIPLDKATNYSIAWVRIRESSHLSSMDGRL